MNRHLKTGLLLSVILLAATGAAWAGSASYGAAAAELAIAKGSPLAITDMLRWAAEDEYLARGEYAAIMQRFGTMRPYSNIMASEEQHLSWLRAEYQSRGLPFPADGSGAYLIIPIDLKAAAQAGVNAEIGNIAMYEAFLAQPELARSQNASVKTLFEQLKRASENHLRAFQTQLSKY
ncbi:MAG TPA: hypothetical protein DCG47_11795 [Spirochaetaceae bacterium]|jgi:hypothetical protein|nr:hypothetical protein [Spirochaetaceae bacterium]